MSDPAFSVTAILFLLFVVLPICLYKIINTEDPRDANNRTYEE